ncbi:hypothetical protein KJ633_08905, partial [bacterium]|nr:hypothetical protein [bacterium]
TKALVRRRGGHCAGGARPSLSEAPENLSAMQKDGRRRRAMASKGEPACPLYAGIVGEPWEHKIRLPRRYAPRNDKMKKIKLIYSMQNNTIFLDAGNLIEYSRNRFEQGLIRSIVQIFCSVLK